MKLIENTETKLLKSIPIDDEIPIGWVEVVIEKEVNQYELDIETQNKKIEMDTLLNKGVIVDEFWFNEYYLAQFISLIGVCERENKQVEWKNTKHEWVLLLIHEANSIAFQASMKFQEIYKNT